jgi:hypothetical protein
MNIDEFRAKLRKLGVDIPPQVLKNWAYSELDIIQAPVPAKHGKGSGIRGRSAAWDEEDIPTVAAVWAIRHHPTVKYRPMLELVPCIKQAVRMTYETSTAGYDIPADTASYKQIKLTLQGRPESLRERISEEKWQALLLMWIAAIEKAKRGIPINQPKQIVFHWRSVEVEGGVDYTPDPLGLVTLEKSDHDEIIIMLDGIDFRKQLFMLLGRLNSTEI